MLKRFFEWLKSLFRAKESPLANLPDESIISTPPDHAEPEIVDYENHKYRNFLACPVIYFPKAAANPAIGIVRACANVDDDDTPAVLFMDHISGADVVVAENFRVFSETTLKQAMNLPCRDRLVFLYPETNPAEFESVENVPGPSTYEEIGDKLEKTNFYSSANMYFRTVSAKDT